MNILCIKIEYLNDKTSLFHIFGAKKNRKCI